MLGRLDVGDGWSLVVGPKHPLCRLSRGEEPGCWQLHGIRWQDAGGNWHSIAGWQVEACTTEMCIATPAAGEAPGVRLELTTGQPPGWVIVSVTAPKATWIQMDLGSRADEHFLGLGERFDRIDQRGQQVDLQVVNGASGGLAYKPVPFYISSAGYGLLVAGDQRTLLRLATPDDPNLVSIRTQAPALVTYIVPGSSPKAILSAYTALAGRPPLPPQWIFGPWKSRDWTAETQETVLEDVNQGRRLDLPGTVKLIDAAWQPYYQSFTFDRQRFPDPEGMIRHVRDLGYRIVLWVAPWIVYEEPPSETYRLCAERGYFLRTPQGEPYVHRLANSPTFVGSCIDFTNPEAVDWWQNQIRRLARMGIDGFKTDFGEQVPLDARCADGRAGHEVHNIYPRLYNQATAEALSLETNGGQPDRQMASSPWILLARSAWHGSQRYCAVWAGDQSSDFGPATGLPSVILAGQNAGLSGFPFWACDIGGYFGVPTDEVFVRWAQFGAFSPIMQLHGLGCREPWRFAPETLAIYRRYAGLHMDLLPYLYTLACEAVTGGVPMMRSLALEFPRDPGVWSDLAAHEYCLGSHLLVSPVYYSGDHFRYAYLPHGNWLDFWTGEALDGGRVHRFRAELDTIPVAARAGAVIPWLDPPAHTCLPVADPSVRTAGDDLRVSIYAGADGDFTMHDGTRLVWRDASGRLSIAGSIPRQLSANIIGRAGQVLSAVGPGNQRLPWEHTDLAGAPADARIAVSGPEQHLVQWGFAGSGRPQRWGQPTD